MMNIQNYSKFQHLHTQYLHTNAHLHLIIVLKDNVGGLVQCPVRFSANNPCLNCANNTTVCSYTYLLLQSRLFCDVICTERSKFFVRPFQALLLLFIMS